MRSFLIALAFTLAGPALAADATESWFIAGVTPSNHADAKVLCHNSCFALDIGQTPGGSRAIAMYDNDKLGEVLKAFGATDLSQLRMVRFTTEDAKRAPVLQALVDTAISGCRPDGIIKC